MTLEDPERHDVSCCGFRLGRCETGDWREVLVSVGINLCGAPGMVTIVRRRSEYRLVLTMEWLVCTADGAEEYVPVMCGIGGDLPRNLLVGRY